MDSEQRRKRKLFLLKPNSQSAAKLFSIRSLVISSSFFIFLLFLSSDKFSFTSAPSRPSGSKFSRLPLSAAASSSLQDSFTSRGKAAASPLRIEDRVLFPDHVLLLVSNRGLVGEGLECVYHREVSNGSFDRVIRLEAGERESAVRKPALSEDELDEFRSIVRCPLPPANYSAGVHLRRMNEGMDGWLTTNTNSNRSVHLWDTVAYEAVIDGDSAVVFVKGMNLRPDRLSDPRQFSCHFGLGNWEKNGTLVLQTEALTAAQEVVRCALPRSIRKKLNKVQGVRVTVGMDTYVHGRVSNHIILPSVAKISTPGTHGVLKNLGKKHELCVCTMLWNQAASLREWIMYHTWLGVERWFIYDNNSDDHIKDVIEELESKHYNVSRHTWPWIKTQEAGFSHCAIRARDECNWVGFFDVDEFFYFPFPTRRKTNLGVPGENSLRALVANFSASETIGEIRTACHSFGPSGLRSSPSQGVTLGYTCRLQSPERHKSIVRPDALDATLLNVVHHFRLKKPFTSHNVLQSTALVNHYKYQAWEVFKAKFFRRVATYVADWQQNQNEGSRDRAPGLGTEAVEPPNWPLQFCEVWDTGLRDLVLANFADPTSGLLPWERS